MATKAVHPLVLGFLQSCLDGAHRKDECESRLYDGQGSKYLLTRQRSPTDLIRVAISIAGFRENVAVAESVGAIQRDLQHRFGEVAIINTEQNAYQFVLEISSDRLKGSEPAYCETYLQGVAAVQSHILGWPLRQALLGLQTPDVPASGVLVVYSKPELPLLVEKHNTHCSVFYPIWLPDGASRAYTAAFIQGFAETKRLGAGGDLPQAIYVPGPVPLAVPEQAQASVSQATGGYVSLTILPRHVKDASLDDLVWSLLTFHEYIQYHVKCFKALVHSRMRKRMQSMVLELGQAKKHTREVLAAINLNQTQNWA